MREQDAQGCSIHRRINHIRSNRFTEKAFDGEDGEFLMEMTTVMMQKPKVGNTRFVARG
jgi:hypothetical protein